MAKQLMVVFSNAAEGREAEFNDWYERVHIPDVCSVEGVLGAQRYELAAEDPNAPHKFLTIYELDRDGGAVMADVAEGMVSGTFVASDSIDATSASIGFWKPI